MPSDHRLHPSSILFALGGSLRSFLLPAVVLMLTSGRSSPAPSGPPGWGPAAWMNRWMPGNFEIANWQFWLLLFLIPATIAALVRYFSFRLHYEGTELVIRSGIIFRNERHVPYARIQNLDATRNVVHRLFRVAQIRVETGGGETPEATISVLHETVFEEMRRRIFEGRAQTVPAALDQGAATETPAAHVESRTLLHLPPRELLLNGVLDNRGAFVMATLYGVLWEAGLLGAFWDRVTGFAYGSGMIGETVSTIAAGKIPSLLPIGILILGLIGVLLAVRILSMLWSVLRLYDFRLTRIGDDVRTEYGMLTRVSATIPLRRVQSLTVRETPLQRLVSRMSVRVETAGGHGSQHDGGKKQPRESLAPLIRRDAVPALVREVLPGFDLDALDWQPLHPRAFRRAIKPQLVLLAIATIGMVAWLGWPVLVLLPLALAWVAFATAKHVAHTHWTASDDAVVFRSGWWWRQITVVPIVKIQVVGRTESPFDRRAAMAGIRVDTAGSASPVHRISIPYLARETAAMLYERLAAQTAHTAFRW